MTTAFRSSINSLSSGGSLCSNNFETIHNNNNNNESDNNRPIINNFQPQIDHLQHTFIADIRQFSDSLSRLHLSLSSSSTTTPSSTDNNDDSCGLPLPLSVQPPPPPPQSSSLFGSEEFGSIINGETTCVQVHQALSFVNKSIRYLLHAYPFIKTSEVLLATSQLVHIVKELNFDSRSDIDEQRDRVDRAIDKLESAVADTLRHCLISTDYKHLIQSHPHESSEHQRRLSSEELLNGARIGVQSMRRGSDGGSSSSGGDVVNRRRNSTLQSKPSFEEPLSLTSDEMDKMLVYRDDGVDLAFERTKAWSKYCKEILAYVQRRLVIESEHARAVQKLCDQTKMQINDHFMPLKNVFMSSFESETQFCDHCTETVKRLTDRFIKPLEQRKNEHDYRRRQLKLEWTKHCKILQDTHMELKKAHQSMDNRKVAYVKARDTSLKAESSATSNLDAVRRRRDVDRRRKIEEDAYVKQHEAIENCRRLEKEVQLRKEIVETSKVRIIADLRELVYQCDQTTKACSQHYFQALSQLWVAQPSKYQEFAEIVRTYVPGNEYMSFLQNLPGRSASSTSLLRTPTEQQQQQQSFSEDDDMNSTISSTSQHHRRNAIGPIDHAAPPLTFVADRSTANRRAKRAGRLLEPFTTSSSSAGRTSSINSSSSHTSSSATVFTDAAQSHRATRIRAPMKCSHCDNLSLLSTVQCAQCGMYWHKSCFPHTLVHCGPTARMLTTAARRMSIFGVALKGHLDDQRRSVPMILERCVDELQRRGARVKGLYRTCGVKSKVEQICENFEKATSEADVDLSDVHPMNIASVIKLYLRQLPEPLMTSELYSQWISFGKRFDKDQDLVLELFALVDELRQLVAQLPSQNRDTLRFLILHLHRMTWFELDNLMTAANIGAVISPSLMWSTTTSASNSPNIANSSTALAVDTSFMSDAHAQSRTIELLIKYAYLVFEVDGEADWNEFFDKYRNVEQPIPVDPDSEGKIPHVEALEDVDEDDDDDEDDEEDDADDTVVEETNNRGPNADNDRTADGSAAIEQQSPTIMQNHSRLKGTSSATQQNEPLPVDRPTPAPATTSTSIPKPISLSSSLPSSTTSYKPISSSTSSATSSTTTTSYPKTTTTISGRQIPRPIPAPRYSQLSIAPDISETGRQRQTAYHHRDKQRSYTTSILVSPVLDQRRTLLLLPPKHRSMEDEKAAGSVPNGGDSSGVTIDVGKEQYFMAHSDRASLTTARSQRDLRGTDNTSDDSMDNNRLCLQSVGLLFSGADVSYV